MAQGSYKGFEGLLHAKNILVNILFTLPFQSIGMRTNALKTCRIQTDSNRFQKKDRHLKTIHLGFNHIRAIGHLYHNTDYEL